MVLLNRNTLVGEVQKCYETVFVFEGLGNFKVYFLASDVNILH